MKQMNNPGSFRCRDFPLYGKKFAVKFLAICLRFEYNERE